MREKCHRHKGSEVVLLCATRTLHKQVEKRSKKAKKDKYRISSFFVGIGEWRKCARQRQRDLSEIPLEDLPQCINSCCRRQFLKGLLVE